MKLKYLLPIVTITSAATFVTPIVSCGHGEEEVTMDLKTIKNIYAGSSPIIYCLTIEEAFTTNLETTYVFNVDLADYDWEHGFLTEPAKQGLFIMYLGDLILPMEDEKRVKISSADLTIDGETLSHTTQVEPSLEDKSIYIGNGEAAAYRFDAITTTSKLTFTIKVSEPKDGVKPIFIPMMGG